MDNELRVRTYRYAVSKKKGDSDYYFQYLQNSGYMNKFGTSYKNGVWNTVYLDPYMSLMYGYGNGTIPDGVDVVTRTLILSNTKDMQKKNTYALYRGDELLAVGTLQEIARSMNVSVKTIIHYGTPAWKYRENGDWNNSRILIKIEDDSDEKEEK